MAASSIDPRLPPHRKEPERVYYYIPSKKRLGGLVLARRGKAVFIQEVSASCVAERIPIFSWWRPPLACTKGSLLLQMFVAERHEVRKSKPRAKRHFDRMEREPEPDTHVTNAASLMLNINFFVHLVRTQSNRPPKYILMVTSPFSFETWVQITYFVQFHGSCRHPQ